MRACLALLSLFYLSSSAPAWAGRPSASGVTADEVASALQEKGYRAEIGTDNVGDPYIKSGADGMQFVIYFYGCNQEKRCKSIQFMCGIDAREGLSVQQTNAWNRSKRFARMYLDDENDPFIKMDVDMNYADSKSIMLGNFSVWLILLSDFKQFVIQT